MRKKYLIFYILITLACLVSGNHHTVTAQEGEGLSVPKGDSFSLIECIKLAAERSSEVKLAKLDFLIASTDQMKAESIFDTYLFANMGYLNDKSEQVSIFSPDHTKVNSYSAGASKTLPTGTELSVTFSDTRTWSNSKYTTLNPSHEAEVSLEARQALAKNSFGYIDRRTISVTSLAIKSADLASKERIELLLAEVEKAYWNWAFARRNLEIYHDILDKARKLHQANARNYEIGLIEKGDFLASEANVILREKDLLLADNNYRQAEENIKLLMNVDAQRRLYPGENLSYRPLDGNLEECLREAIAQRRDYEQAKQGVKMKNLILETKENSLWPEIDLVATMAANGINSQFDEAAERITTEENTNYYAGLEITLPLENKLARSEREKASYEKEKSLVTLKKIERVIITEVSNDFRDYATYKVNLEKLREVAELQHEKLKEEEKRFSAARSSTKMLIDYQQDYLGAQLQLAAGLLDLEIARTDLEKTLNAILEKYGDVL